jgi:hypothetical protein
MKSDSLDQPTLFVEDSHVRMSQSLANALESLEQEVDSSSMLWNLQSTSKPNTSSWRMCQDFFQATTDAISESLSLKWPTQGIATSNGDFLIRNSSEFPNEERESSLLDLLQTEVDHRYSLSAKACLGILERSERRGKTLPTQLKQALLECAGDLGGCSENLVVQQEPKSANER